MSSIEKAIRDRMDDLSQLELDGLISTAEYEGWVKQHQTSCRASSMDNLVSCDRWWWLVQYVIGLPFTIWVAQAMGGSAGPSVLTMLLGSLVWVGTVLFTAGLIRQFCVLLFGESCGDAFILATVLGYDATILLLAIPDLRTEPNLMHVTLPIGFAVGAIVFWTKVSLELERRWRMKRFLTSLPHYESRRFFNPRPQPASTSFPQPVSTSRHPSHEADMVSA